MTYDKHSMSAKQFVMISVSSPYKILKSDKHLSSGQNIAIWLVLYLLTFPLMLTANALLLSLFSTVTSNPYLGLGLVASIFSMLFYILYIPFFILNSYIIYKFSDKAKPFEKIFSDNSSMLIFPFLLYSVGAMMTAYIIGILSLIGLLIMWGGDHHLYRPFSLPAEALSGSSRDAARYSNLRSDINCPYARTVNHCADSLTRDFDDIL